MGGWVDPKALTSVHHVSDTLSSLCLVVCGCVGHKKRDKYEFGTLTSFAYPVSTARNIND